MQRLAMYLIVYGLVIFLSAAANYAWAEHIINGGGGGGDPPCPGNVCNTGCNGQACWNQNCSVINVCGCAANLQNCNFCNCAPGRGQCNCE